MLGARHMERARGSEKIIELNYSQECCFFDQMNIAIDRDKEC